MALAGLGVSLAGFAGLISALDRRPAASSVVAAWRIRNIVIRGFMVTFAGFATVALYTIIEPTATGKLMDTVGAGDAFTAVIILGLLHDWDLEQTLQRAQAFASAIVGIRGATPESRDFYTDFRQQWDLM